jgi:hypothetical protein
MIILFNKATNPDILSIEIGTFVADQYYWTTRGGNYWCVDETNNKIICGGETTAISFRTKDSMKPYIDQLLATDPTIVDPAINPINTDPYLDKPKTGSIVSHTYINTDVEKELVDGTFKE